MQVPCGTVFMDVCYSPYIKATVYCVGAAGFLSPCDADRAPAVHYRKISLTCACAEHAQGPSYLRARQAGRFSVACGGAGGANDGEGAGEAGELRASHMSAVRECVVRA